MVKCGLFLFVLFASVICVSHSARILGVFHMTAHSHFVLGETLLKELARKGHDVTMISSFPQKIPINNYRDIPLTKPLEIINERNKEASIFEFLKVPLVALPPLLGTMGLNLTEVVFQEAPVQDLLNSGEKFDVVIVEQFLNEAHKGLAYHFNASLVVLSTIGSSLWTNHLVGNPNPYSLFPNVFLSYSARMTFFQRVINTLFSTYEFLYNYLYFINKQNEILQKYIPGAPDIRDVMYNTSLILLNSHVSYSSAKPHVPNMIDIGGFHVKNAEELPEDLKQFLDHSKEGVIYFSLGSNIKSKDMPKEKVEHILKAISKLEMNVLWKYEDENLQNIPKNLKIGKWFPQQSILAHPNVKLFITHGGLLSTIETIYYGVPVLGIPIFADQKMNMAETVEQGCGLTIDFMKLNEDHFYTTIRELIDHPRYSENAKLRSRLLRDRPMKPLDLAVYWVEYIARHKGSTHFRSPALDLRWYQYLLLDVILFIIVTMAIWVIVSYHLFRFIFLARKSSKVKQQ